MTVSLSVVSSRPREKRTQPNGAHLHHELCRNGVILFLLWQVHKGFGGVVRDQLDEGRSDQVAVIFDRRISRRTPGTFRTQVLT